MAAKSKIEHGQWWDVSWNPSDGCTKISEGCKYCWAEGMAMRFTGHFNVTLHPERLDQPLHWRKPRRIFVSSMGDLFHEDVPDEFIDLIFFSMLKNKQHTFLILTKRPERMADYIQSYKVPIATGNYQRDSQHIWFGVTVESDKYLWRIEKLLQIPAAKRFVSLEPMLGSVDFATMVGYPLSIFREADTVTEISEPHAPNIKRPGRGIVKISMPPKLDWVIIGAESGAKRRECKIKDVRDVVGQCKAAGIPVFIKQLHINGKLSKNMDEWPPDLRVREWPE